MKKKKKKKKEAFYQPQREDSRGEGWPSRQRNITCFSAACFQNKAVALGNADVTFSALQGATTGHRDFFFYTINNKLISICLCAPDG